MSDSEKLLFEGHTKLDHYQVVDMTYEGRRARVLFNGDRLAAFSGMPLDGEQELLFDYIQRFFELVCHVRPHRLLMIGGGVYTLPMTLIQALPDIKIDVVEIDSGLDYIAETYFGFNPNKRLQIIHAEGKAFLASCSNSYDMIIIDAFTELRIPQSLSELTTSQLIYERLKPEGIVAVNIIASYLGRHSQLVQQLYGFYNSVFTSTSVYPADPTTSLWTSQNFILISQKGKTAQTYGLRYGALDPPDKITG